MRRLIKATYISEFESDRKEDDQFKDFLRLQRDETEEEVLLRIAGYHMDKVKFYEKSSVPDLMPEFQVLKNCHKKCFNLLHAHIKSKFKSFSLDKNKISRSLKSEINNSLKGDNYENEVLHLNELKGLFVDKKLGVRGNKKMINHELIPLQEEIVQLVKDVPHKLKDIHRVA